MNINFEEWNNKDIVIYGSNRIEALFTLIYMINEYRKINYVCIKGDMYAGLNMLNIKCISFEEAKKMQENCIFVVSPEDYNEVNRVFDNIYLYSDYGKEEKIDIGSVLQPIKGEYFYHIALDAEERKLIIYGTDEAAQILCNKLDLIGISVSFFVDNEKAAASVCGKSVCSVYDLLYEDPDAIMVINTNSDLEESTKVLTGLGLKEGVNFRYIQQYEYNYYRWYHWLDPQLGYNMVNKDCEKYPGFYVYGNENPEDYKIVIGGGLQLMQLCTHLGHGRIFYMKQ